jgi:hypothetical protein
VTKFDTSSFEAGEAGSETDGDRDRKSYRFWWQHALRDIRQVSIISWAQRVERRYCQLSEKPIDNRERLRIYKQAMDAAMYADGRFVGDWSTEKAIEMSRLDDDQAAAMMRGQPPLARRYANAQP